MPPWTGIATAVRAATQSLMSAPGVPNGPWDGVSGTIE
jgi:hypothetical protein